VDIISFLKVCALLDDLFLYHALIEGFEDCSSLGNICLLLKIPQVVGNFFSLDQLSIKNINKMIF